MSNVNYDDIMLVKEWEWGKYKFQYYGRASEDSSYMPDYQIANLKTYMNELSDNKKSLFTPEAYQYSGMSSSQMETEVKEIEERMLEVHAELHYAEEDGSFEEHFGIPFEEYMSYMIRKTKYAGEHKR